MNLHKAYLLSLIALFTVIFVVKTDPTFALPHPFVRLASMPRVLLPPATPIERTPAVREPQPLYDGTYAIVNLRLMQISLHDGTTTLATMPIISIGKPGSYYETIGGTYENDYKIRSHFSTIGHVYMPWSVHVFGNFFIHGIPYYENGTKVSSEYSGGCIRLSDADAKTVYEFIEKGTPIVVTENNDDDFVPTVPSADTFPSMDMTRTMAAVVSLEVLTQDTPVYDPTTKTTTTRRKLLPRLLVDRDDSVISIYTKERGDETFLMYMNLKAKALGMTNTTFTSPSASALTSEEDRERFADYIKTYKTYLLSLASPTQRAVSQ
jgi:hypothetical protein